MESREGWVENERQHQAIKEHLLKMEIEIARLAGEARVVPLLMRYAVLPLIIALAGALGVKLAGF